MARRFAKVSEEEIEEAFFYPSDLANTKTTIPLRVGEEWWIYTETRTLSSFLFSLRGIVVYYLSYSYQIKLFCNINHFIWPSFQGQLVQL